MPARAEARNEGRPPGPFGMIVLAGGRGARLGGADKPGLVVGRRTLISAVVAAGITAGAGQIIVVGPRRPGLDEVSFVTEQPPGAGPVPALRRGLAEAQPPWVAVLAADLPFFRAGHLGVLLRAASGHQGAVLADQTGRPQWLAGCWRTGTVRRAAAGYQGTSLGGLLGPLDPVLVRLVPAPGEPPPWLDCDTPEDLRAARAWTPPPGQESAELGEPAGRGESAGLGESPAR